MTNAATTAEQDNDNIISFDAKKKELIARGGTKPPEDMLWLRRIPLGYAVIIRPKNPAREGRFLGKWLQVIEHFDVCACIYEGQTRNTFWVHSDDFSRDHECMEVIPIEYPKEETNGDSNRSDQPTGLVDTEVS